MDYLEQVFFPGGVPTVRDFFAFHTALFKAVRKRSYFFSLISYLMIKNSVC